MEYESSSNDLFLKKKKKSEKQELPQKLPSRLQPERVTATLSCKGKPYSGLYSGEGQGQRGLVMGYVLAANVSATN